MLQHLRKPKWQHPKASVRRQAVEQLSADADSDGILTALARDDDDAGVRRAAIRKLSDLALLRERMEQDPDSGVVEAAAVRYRQMLAGGSGADDLEARIAELQHCANPRVLAHVARGGREEALRIAALERCGDESVLADAAINDPIARVRQAAVSRLEDPSALKRVAERTRQGDRKVSRLARDKLEAREAEAEARERRAAERAAVIAELRALVEAGEAPRGGALTRLENRWQAVAEDVGTAESEQFGRLLAECRRLRERPPEAAPATETGASDWRALWDELSQASEPDAQRLEALESTLPTNGPEAEGIELTTIRAYLTAARQYLEKRPVTESLLSRADAGTEGDDRAQALEDLASLVHALDWPEAASSPKLLRRAQEVLSAVEAAGRRDEAEKRAASAERIQALNEQLGEVDQALREGNLRRAQRALRKAREVAEGAPAAEASRSERELRRYAARVAELRDWRRFATLPKQEQLCEQMEALVGADMPPPELATAIKSLQDEWKETGGSDSAESRRLWERFQRASDRAFEPCRAFFDAQAEERAANLVERERIAEQLQEFMDQADWESLEIRKLIDIRAKAREEWNHYSPVDRGPAKPVTRRFESLMDRLSKRIKAVQDENRRRKAELLEQVKALDPATPLAQRLEAAKDLQSRWRQIGPAQPAQDRKLFRAFKAACDAIFAERDQDRQVEESRREADKAEAERLCEQLEAIPEGQLADQAALREALEDLEARFRALGPLPQGVQEGVERRFAKAAGAVRRDIAIVQAAQLEDSYRRLHALSDVCAQLEAAVAAREPVPWESLRARWAAVGETPEALTEPLQRRWERAAEAAESGGFAPSLWEAAAEQARRLCVGMEIMAGLDSPEADADLRMQLQVERLSAGLGAADAGEQTAGETVRSLEVQWLANGPVPEAERRALEPRFQAAREAALRALQTA